MTDGHQSVSGALPDVAAGVRARLDEMKTSFNTRRCEECRGGSGVDGRRRRLLPCTAALTAASRREDN
ncbi:hypothetical protein E2C01_000397 [Portunus trituberculatus]|uniref:Uncharacterized protein n=1 Tax=Portunus trituberculatus TaxID=210409 RepID=A0A5B7CF36_PORTR|nr:hypothetical protein [Portunus trituberculatus]